jgi:hypothetical protein
MRSDFDPYAPPKESAPPRSPTDEVLASCTVLVTATKKQRRPSIAERVRRYMYPALAAVTGFAMMGDAAIGARVVSGLVCGVLVWTLLALIAKRIAKRPAFKHVALYRFYEDGFDVEAEGSLSRFEWSRVHDFVDGPDGLILHTGRAHVFPTRGLPTDDVAALRALFASKVTLRDERR